MISEKVKEDILKLIYDSIKNNKIIDANFVEKIYEMIVSDMELQKYVRKLQIENQLLNEDNTLGEYSKENQTIIIYLERIINFLKKILEKYYDDIYINKKYFIYIGTIQVLLHELEHANQEKKKQQESLSLEILILKLHSAGKMRMLNNQLENLTNGKYSPEEIIERTEEIAKSLQQKRNSLVEFSPSDRLADYYSNSTVLDILNMSKNDTETIKSIIRHKYYYELLIGYDKQKSPTKYYLEQIGIKSTSFLERDYSILPLERQLSLGLEVEENAIQLLRKKEL